MRKIVYLFLDDVRLPEQVYPNSQKDWLLVRNTDELKELIFFYQRNDYLINLSLDHDLGVDDYTGYEFLNWMEARLYDGTLYHETIGYINIHSANPVGRKNMERAIESIMRIKDD